MNLGRITKANEIGYKRTYKYIWSACINCGKERWVKLYKGKPISIRCHRCVGVGESSPHWKGGRRKNFYGYVLILINSESPFASMRDSQGYIRRHRLVMARHLGRCLKSWEIVHHKNNKIDDNRIENLELMTQSEHAKLHKEGGDLPPLCHTPLPNLIG